MISGIGPKEAELIAALGATGERVFTNAEIAKALNISSSFASKLVRQLATKKKLVRIEKGRYLLVPVEAWASQKYMEEGIIVGSRLIEPSYLSYWTALSFYGWTEQVSSTVFIAAMKKKRELFAGGVRYLFVHLRPNRFFGFSEQWRNDRKIIIADKEKAIVDCLDLPKYCGDITEAAKGLWNGRNDFNWDKLISYALRTENGAIIKRLGYLMDALEIKKANVRHELAKHLTAGYVPLNPGGDRTGKYSSEWRVLVNTDPEGLTEWRSH